MSGDVASTRQRFARALTRRFFVRFHMTCILGAVVLSGVGASWLLLHLGLRGLVLRYALAVAASYLVFFLLVRAWLWYVARARTEGGFNALDGVDFPSGGGGGGGGGSLPSFRPGGGGFGGGGASGGYAPAPSMPAPMAQSVGPTSGGGGGGRWFPSLEFPDLGDDGFFILLAFIALLLVIGGAGVYLVYQAPVILAEAAFPGALAPSLLRASRRADPDHWMRSVLRATVIPFALVAVMAGAFGWAAHHYCPDASKLGEVFRTCVFGG